MMLKMITKFLYVTPLFKQMIIMTYYKTHILKGKITGTEDVVWTVHAVCSGGGGNYNLK
jgi:hypothetical protein